MLPSQKCWLRRIPLLHFWCAEDFFCLWDQWSWSLEEITCSINALVLSSAPASFNELFKPSINQRFRMHFTFTLRVMVFFHMCCDYWSKGEIWHDSRSSVAGINKPVYQLAVLVVGHAALKFHSHTLMSAPACDKPKSLRGTEQSTCGDFILIVCLRVCAFLKLIWTAHNKHSHSRDEGMLSIDCV